MAHNLNIDENGKAAFFSVREKPWHGLGTILADYPTTAEALTAGGLNFEVVKEQITRNGADVPDQFFTVRTDNDAVLGIVGDRYRVIQNVDAFGILDSIVGNGDAKWETAGALGNGSSVFVTCKLPDDLKIAGEQYQGYFVVNSTHDGSGALKVMQTPVRVVCQNTLNMAIGAAKRTIGIRHTANWEQQTVEAKRVLDVTRNYYKNFEQIANELVTAKFSKAQFDDLLNDLLKAPAEDASKRAKTMFESRLNDLEKAYMADDLNDIRGTKWGAYNAVADYSDHGRNTRGDNKLENAYTRTFENTTLKDDALALLLAR